ncbi:MAG: hypothetical protein KDB90_03605 [Planctomycetes bacterium]|nr:hypothetical protein [Planctomycetota bacterium]
MVIRITTAALMLAVLAGALAAQEDYTGFPETRVRQVRPETQPPDELYDQNRVIIRKTNLMLTGQGMQISGEVVTDFDADSVPPGEDIPKGQLLGLKVNIELYYYDTVLERDDTTGAVREPKIDVRNPGQLVEGQMTTVKIDDYLGNYGMARFTLPVLEKPLAPGVYRLVAHVRFKTQENKLQAAIKWCGDLYGSRAEADPTTMEIVWHKVMNEPALHDEVYRFLVDTKGELSDVTLLWIGEICKEGNLELVSAAQGTARKPANYMIWSYHLVVIDQVLAFQDQLDNVDEVIDRELENKLKVTAKSGASEDDIKKLNELKEKWKQEAVEDKKRIKRDNADLITKYGGRTSKDENKLHSSAVAARAEILEQISQLQEYLTLKYWILVDGYLPYSGFHRINHPAWQAWDAIDKKDNKAAAVERVTKLKAVQDAAGGLAAKWETRKTQWQYCPPEMVAAAFDYLRTKEEKTDFDPEKFTEKDGEGFILSVDKWVEYRTDFVTKFIEATDKMFAELDTKTIYSVQVWPQALAQVRSARDDVITLAYSWEYYIRTEQMNEDKDTVKDSWRREGDAMPSLHLDNYFSRATNAPGTIKNRFDGSLNLVRSAANVKQFMVIYARGIQAGLDAKAMPGRRPPSAPPARTK